MTIKRISHSFLLIFILAMLQLFTGCAELSNTKNKNVKIEDLPSDIDFIIHPIRRRYKPYERVKINLMLNNNNTFQGKFNFSDDDIRNIYITELSTVNDEYTYNVDWKNIHYNIHGFKDKTTRITWYLDDDWNKIIPQKPGEYFLQFIIATPNSYWKTKKIPIKIYLSFEDSIPFNELEENDLLIFFEYRYLSRMYNENWSTYDSCPKKRLPYERMQEYILKYPHYYLTRTLKQKLKITKDILKNKNTQYDLEDMHQVDMLLKIYER